MSSTALTRMTPQQIDEILANLYEGLARAHQGADAALVNLHHALVERRLPAAQRGGRAQWPTTNAQAIVKLVNIVADPGYAEPPPYSWHQSPAKALERVDTARARVREALAALVPYEAEFTRRGGWTRFFTVAGGHIHASMNCQTCHRDGKTTDMGWTPQLSGRTEAEAMAELGPRAFALCTVCFPHAPLEFTVKQERPSCPGSRRTPQPTTKIQHYGVTRYGRCTGCNDLIRLNTMGQVIKHSPKKEDEAA